MKKNLRSPFLTRQYMLSQDFELYYYSDSSMPRVKSHTHDYYEFYFFLSGKVDLYIQDVPYRLSPGDMVILPPNLPHHAVILDDSIPYQRFVFWISDNYCSSLMAQTPSYGYLLQQAATQKKYLHHFAPLSFQILQSKMIGILEEIHSNRYGKEALLSVLVNDFLLHLNRTIYEIEHPPKGKDSQPLFENLVSYLDAHLEEDLSLEQLARVFYVSKYYIAHLWKEHLGISLHQYITKKRLLLAMQAITGGGKISEVCYQCGFQDYSVFYRAFKKEYGLSPKDYQQLHAGGLGDSI